MNLQCYIGIVILIALISVIAEEDDDLATREPSLCEVCKFLVTELKDRLFETGKSREILRTGQGLENKKEVKYSSSELRLIEALQEPHICERILDYNVHAEFKGAQRFKKGMSETMQTLHGLVDKGVQVVLGIPYEMWDQPPAEVTLMQRKCFTLVEEYEDDIEEWYYHRQNEDLMDYFCRERVLKRSDQACLDENLHGKESKNLKGDAGSKGKKSGKDKIRKTSKEEL
ncbi:protein canopy homolog 4-like [Gigantopelta aegis]|uniref:protein canopy homolog 4-like n=1 Tax=Gigantopelta aegis TaxID=1735272 RepID=UPI001B88952F|nr:protein canopy homolog 4-like [Gigantopelta aegis]